METYSEQTIMAVRILIPDTKKLLDPADLTKPERYLFTDEEITGYLALNGGNARRAAADAIEAIGTDSAMQLLVIQTDDKATRGDQVLSVMLRRAKQLRDEADAEEAASLEFCLIANPWGEPGSWH